MKQSINVPLEDVISLAQRSRPLSALEVEHLCTRLDRYNVGTLISHADAATAGENLPVMQTGTALDVWQMQAVQC